MHRLDGIFAAFTILLGLAITPAAAQDKTLTVFAAASMKNALDDIDAAYTAKTGVKIVASYAASSALAKQIEQGAPADIFASADTDWMDYAISEHQVNQLGNRRRRRPCSGQRPADLLSDDRAEPAEQMEAEAANIKRPCEGLSKDANGAGHCATIRQKDGSVNPSLGRFL